MIDAPLAGFLLIVVALALGAAASAWTYDPNRHPVSGVKRDVR